MTDAPDEAVSFETMVQTLDLTDVTFYEVSSRLDELTAPEVPEDNADEETELKVSWRVRIRHQDLEFGVRLRVEVRNKLGICVADVAAEYVSESRITVSKDTVTEFVNNVALMQLYPFIRESVMTLAAKTMRTNLLMPIFQRGELVLELGDGPEMSSGAPSLSSLSE